MLKHKNDFDSLKTPVRVRRRNSAASNLSSDSGTGTIRGAHCTPIKGAKSNNSLDSRRISEEFVQTRQYFDTVVSFIGKLLFTFMLFKLAVRRAELLKTHIGEDNLSPLTEMFRSGNSLGFLEVPCFLTKFWTNFFD